MQIGEILTSIQVPELIKDEFIRGGRFELSRRGQPIHFSGGFTVVFPCVVNGEKWAFRCWFNDLGNTRSRFQKLSEALQAHPLKYLCEFYYVDEGIVVNGKTYPTTRMKWVDGINIKDYVCKYRNDKNRLQVLAKTFLQMCKDMHANHYSHGDLQHGNIMVNDEGEVFLIDYDSLYHVSMGDMPDIIAGLKDYQHPLRKNNTKASEKVDYFSEVIIYTAILAVAENPSLADRYDLEDSESMLFQAIDYENFINSNIYDDLRKLGGLFIGLLNIISTYLGYNSINDLQPIEIILDAVVGTPEIISLSVEQPSNNIYIGDEVTIRWEINHAFEQKLNDNIIDISHSYYTEEIKWQTDYKLTISNGIQTVSKAIQIKPLPIPKIKFISSTDKLRKGKNEKFNLKWNVKDAKSVSISRYSDDKKIGEGKSGSLTLTTETDELYGIKVVGYDGERVFEEQIKVSVLEACIVEFNVDKEYSLPSVPIFISWKIKHAKRAWIEGIPGYDKINLKGNATITVSEDTTIKLNIEDKFGVNTIEKTIRMLPLPIVQSLIRPKPEFTTNVSVGITLTRPNVAINCPTILQPSNPIFTPQVNLSMVGIDIPFVESISLQKENFLEKGWKKIKETSYQVLSNLLLKIKYNGKK